MRWVDAYGSATRLSLSEKLGFNQDASGENLKKKSDRQLAMYNALRKAGISESQALAIGGGRSGDENDTIVMLCLVRIRPRQR